jgi:hypothetical protein
MSENDKIMLVSKTINKNLHKKANESVGLDLVKCQS